MLMKQKCKQKNNKVNKKQTNTHSFKLTTGEQYLYYKNK
jgi:hypothetical protein